MKEFKISCYSIAKIMSGSIGITDIQSAKLLELQTRKYESAANVTGVKPLTPNMEKELAELIQKRDNPELPEGAKTFLKTWVKRKLFNRKEEWKSIVIDKGLAVEYEGIQLLKRVLHLEEDLDKNDEFFENDFMYGCPDILPYDQVRDIKCSWDLFTFPMFDKKMPNEDYWWQLQGYMILTGRRKAFIDYTLIDTPKALIELDLKKLYYQSGGRAEDWNPEKYEELMPNYRFDDIPEKMRVRSFEVLFDPSAEQRIKERVLLCRKFIKTIVPEEMLKAA